MPRLAVAGVLHACLALRWLAASMRATVNSGCSAPPPEDRFVEKHLGETGKMLYVKGRENLPVYGEDLVKVDLYYMESVVGASAGKQKEIMMNMLGQYHSGIRGELLFSTNIRKTFVLELWGNGKSTGAPFCVDEEGPKWEHNNAIVFTDGWDKSKWFGSRTEGVRVATLNDAAGVNALFDWVVSEWVLNPAKRTYTQWQWWPDATPGAQRKRSNYDVICDSFTEDVIWKLSELTQLASPIPILRRNYGVVMTTVPGEVVDKADPRVVAFFTNVVEKGLQSAYFFDVNVGNPVVVWDQASDTYLYYPKAWVTIKYVDMPMPPAYYQTCSHWTNGPCSTGFCLPFRHAVCSDESWCVCPDGTCSFESAAGKYCKGPEAPGVVYDDDVSHTSSFLSADGNSSKAAVTADPAGVGAGLPAKGF